MFHVEAEVFVELARVEISETLFECLVVVDVDSVGLVVCNGPVWVVNIEIDLV